MAVVLEYYEPKPNRPYHLGRHREHDDLNWLSRWRGAPSRQLDTIWSIEAPVLNQGATESCTGNAMAQLLNTDKFSESRKEKHNNTYLTEADALSLYSQATFISGIGGGMHWPPDDVGSTGPAVAQAAENDGYITNFQHCFSWAAFLSAIESQPVMLGTLWTDSMYTANVDGTVTVGPLNDDTVAGGHEYMCRGVLHSEQLVLCRNSWSDQWNPSTLGFKLPGEFYLHFADLQTLLSNAGDITVPIGVESTAAGSQGYL